MVAVTTGTKLDSTKQDVLANTLDILDILDILGER